MGWLVFKAPSTPPPSPPPQLWGGTVARLSKAEIEVSRLPNKTQRVEVNQETFVSPLESQVTTSTHLRGFQIRGVRTSFITS